MVDICARRPWPIAFMYIHNCCAPCSHHHTANSYPYDSMHCLRPFMSFRPRFPSLIHLLQCVETASSKHGRNFLDPGDPTRPWDVRSIQFLFVLSCSRRTWTESQLFEPSARFLSTKRSFARLSKRRDGDSQCSTEDTAGGAAVVRLVGTVRVLLLHATVA